MVVNESSSTVSLDHLYAKKVDLLDDDDLFSSSADFLTTWTQVRPKVDYFTSSARYKYLRFVDQFFKSC